MPYWFNKDKIKLLLYCRYNPSLSVAKVAKHYKLKESEASLKWAVANRGPVSVAVDASHLQFYKSGDKNTVYTFSNCSFHSHGCLRFKTALTLVLKKSL